MADSTIQQRITLDGVEDVVAGLKQLGDASQKVQQQLTNAFKQTNLSGVAKQFDGLRESGGKFIDEFAKVATIFGAGFGLGGGGLLAGLATLATSSASAVKEIDNLAEASGSSIEQMSGMSDALSQLGVDSETLQGAFRRLAQQVATQWPVVQQQIRASADTIAQSFLSVEEAQIRASDAAKAYGRAQEDANNLAISNANSLESAELALIELRNKAGQFTGVDPGQIAQRRQALTLSQAELAVVQAKEKADRDAIDQQNKLEQAAIAAETAQLNLNKARREAADAQANDINNLRTFIDNLSKGFSETGQKVNLTTENLVRGIIASVGPGVQAISALGGSFGNLSQQTPAVRDVVLKLASIFQNMRDETQKTALAVALFGREAGPALARALSGGPEALLTEEERVKQLGLALTESDAQIAKAFNKSKAALTDTAEAIKNKLGSAFGPAATALMDSFRETLEGSVVPAVIALKNVLTGVSFDSFAKTSTLSPDQLLRVGDWQKSVQDIVTNIRTVGTVISTVFTGIVGPIIRTVMFALNGLAAAFNAVFGTSISGAQLGIVLALGEIVLVIGRATGAFALLGSIVSTLFGGPILALGIALLALVANFDKLAGVLQPLADKLNHLFGTDFISGIGIAEIAVGTLATAFAATLIPAVGRAAIALLLLVRSNPWILGLTLAAGAVVTLAQKFGLLDDATAELKKKFSDLSTGTKDATGTVSDAKSATENFGQATRQATGVAGAAWAQVNPFISSAKTNIESASKAAQQFGAASASGAKQASAAWAQVNPFVKQAADGIKRSSDDAAASVRKMDTSAAAQNVNFDSVDSAGLNATVTKVDGVKTSLADLQKQMSDISAQPITIDTSDVQSKVEELQSTLAANDLSFTNFGGDFQSSATGISAAIGLISDAIGQMSAKWQEGQSEIDANSKTLIGDFGGEFQSAITGLSTAFDLIISKIQSAINLLPGLSAGAAQAVAVSGAGGAGFASGGWVRGAGSGTSDSILARLSNGEFVIRAAAVQHFGPQFFAALNRLRMPGFSFGGLVDTLNGALMPALPRFADGGLVPAVAGSSRHHSIDMRFGPHPGESFRVFAPDTVANALATYSANKRRRSAGRPQSAVGG